MDKTERGTAQADAVRNEDKGLKRNALGFVNNLIFGIAGTAPIYSLAAVIGLVTVTVGVQAPAVLLASFVPMFLVATGFYYMNRADQDCGTTFAWATRAMGPYAGWMGGWIMLVAIVLVTGALADVAARYTFLFFGWQAAAGSIAAVTILAVAFMATMTVVCVRGVEISARIQNVMIVAQLGAVFLFAAVALIKVFGSNPPEGSIQPELSWLSPFAVQDAGALVAGLLICVFIYWGWEASVVLTEESENNATAPGLAAVLSTVILLVTYVSVTLATVAFAGPGTISRFADDDAVFSTLATSVLGAPWDKLVVLAVLTSSLACTQAVIIFGSRTALSMASAEALPARLKDVHARFRTPHVSAIVIGALSVAWYVPLNLYSQNFLFDTLSAMSLLVAFYYALTGLSCVVYFRKELFSSVKNLLFVGVGPLLGSAMLVFLFFCSIPGLSDPEASYTGSSLLGLGRPCVIGIGSFLIGAVCLVVWRLGGHGRFFERTAFEAAAPEILSEGAREKEASDTPMNEAK